MLEAISEKFVFKSKFEFVFEFKSARVQPEVFRALQGALGALGVRLTDLGNDQWSLSDGRSLTRFQDGVVRLLPFCSVSFTSDHWLLLLCTPVDDVNTSEGA